MMPSLKDTDFANPKQLITQTIPGVFAFVPFSFLAFIYFPILKEFSEKHIEIIITAYLFLSILLGALINEVGSWVEEIYDEMFNTQEEWEKYLLQPKNDLIVHSVISAVVLRLKFNINMLVSIILFDVGLVVIALKTNEHHCSTVLTIFISSLLIVFLYKTGQDMAEGLHKYRKQLNDKNTTSSLSVPSPRRCCCKRQRS